MEERIRREVEERVQLVVEERMRNERVDGCFVTRRNEALLNLHVENSHQ